MTKHDHYTRLCLYSFRQGINLRAQMPGSAQNTKVLFDSALLYLPAAMAEDPGFLDDVTALELPEDVVMQLGSKYSQFDAKAYLAQRAEAKRLAEKAAKSKFSTAAKSDAQGNETA